ncbi:hypothetical protein TNIN_373151 [Trichonephila inaurata madagascariensis]|uniref:Uncharacterized protein n=1 Tax=Trichonephila inaurata madagascariensis TaxID=2747483 RepID=A0A8X7CIB0_9ARAC|nr:hypothetical protein TNIN_373151 [Trichonephila inaurata madagascariensis]
MHEYEFRYVVQDTACFHLQDIFPECTVHLHMCGFGGVVAHKLMESLISVQLFQDYIKENGKEVFTKFAKESPLGDGIVFHVKTIEWYGRVAGRVSSQRISNRSMESKTVLINFATPPYQKDMKHKNAVTG